MLTIEELLERHKGNPSRFRKYLPERSQNRIAYNTIRMWDWRDLLEARNQRHRKVPSLLKKLQTFRSEMAEDELELLDSLIAEQHKQEAEGNLSWTRISLHMDTLDLLEKASKKKGMSKSEVAEIAMREYFKTIGIE